MTHPMRWLALAALDEPVLPEPDQLKRSLAEQFNEAPPLEVAEVTPALLTGQLGDYTFGITLVPRPIPPSQLEGPCATAWFWPDAAEAFRGHESHLLITLIDEGGRAVEKSRRLTELTAAILSSVPACGVFWGPGRLVHPPDAFLQQAVQMTAEDLPLFLWVDFRVERTGEETVRMYTTGLEALGQTELEAADFAGSPQRLLEYAYNVAHYQLVEPKALEEGHTIGLTEEVQATIHRTKSMLDETMDVIALEFST